jgi:hypothetical protein
MEKPTFFNRITLSLLLVIGLLATACNPDDIRAIAEEDVEMAEWDAMTEANFEEANQLGYEAMDEAFGRSHREQGLINACATIAHDTAARMLTLDFGSGCVGPDGRTRAGQVIIDYSQRLWRPGASLTISLDSFYVDDHHVQGTLTHQNLASSLADTIAIQTTLIGGQVDWTDGSTSTRSYDRTRTWLRALNPANDQLWVEGTASGSRRDGSSYTSTIVAPKGYRRACRRQGIGIASQGTVLLQRSGRPDVEVDYGSGACDREITLTVNGQTRVITL